jgi:hypothetical protein
VLDHERELVQLVIENTRLYRAYLSNETLDYRQPKRADDTVTERRTESRAASAPRSGPGEKLNFMNLTVLPMVIGTGVDSGIHIVSRFLASGRDATAGVRSALVGVMLASTTTMVGGFGSLALSENHGLTSIGSAALIGTASCLLAAATALPAVLVLVERRARAQRSNL